MEFLMKRKQDPNPSWLEYFNELSPNFVVDDKLMRRHKLRKANLQKPQGKIMILQWRVFKVTLEKSLGKGDAPNEDNLRDHILEQLTPSLLLRE